MKGITVEIEVGHLLKQYVENCLGTDTIVMGNGWVLTDIIKPHLELRSRQLNLFDDKDSESKPAEKDTLMIRMPSYYGKVFNKKLNDTMICDPYYRTVVSPYGQAMVRRHLKKLMHQSFRIYMDGYTAAWEEMEKSKIKSGIIAFFSDYNIEWTEKDVNAMARDWLRYRNKKFDGRICPILC